MTTIKLLDKIHLQKYLYLLSLLCSGKIECAEFEQLFLQVLAQDKYWLSGMFDKEIATILDAFLVDIKYYSLDYLYDPDNFVNVNLISTKESGLRSRAEEALNKLEETVNICYLPPFIRNT